jgi:hypothetical protein
MYVCSRTIRKRDLGSLDSQAWLVPPILGLCEATPYFQLLVVGTVPYGAQTQTACITYATRFRTSTHSSRTFRPMICG